MLKIPQWADVALSSELPNIRSAGESNSIEFKERWPDQTHKIAREFAALATSGGGILFIGVNDAGELIGIKVNDGDERDDLFERVQGVIQSVRPTLKYEILFGVENNIPVLAVRIPTQQEPVFYYENRPYIRDGRRSRPATPEEVKESVWSHPSSDYQREIERIKLQQLQDNADSNKRYLERMSEIRDRPSKF